MIISVIFYLTLDTRYILLLLGSVWIDFKIAQKIVDPDKPKAGKRLLAASLVMNLGLLFGFKYFGMFGSSLTVLLNSIGVDWQTPALQIAIPAGVSFFTFKKISYVVDVYKGKIKPETDFGPFFVYVIHFLEILSGPIDRAGDLLPQIKRGRAPDYDMVKSGALLILYGLFMKVVVADRLAVYTDAIFNNVRFHHGPSLVLAAYLYAFQIYADFAGYTNIAIGGGRLLGFELAPNFNLPYFSQSISDFWRRWHMTLSYWFRDYLYIPLGGNRVSSPRRAANLMIVFLLCGLWHGANWTFVVWGGIHGAYLVVGFITRPFRTSMMNRFVQNEKWVTVLRIFITFHLVTFSWIFFRAASLRDAFYYVAHLTSGWPQLFLDNNTIGNGLLGLIILFGVEILQYNRIIVKKNTDRWPPVVRWACVYSLIFLIILAGTNSESAFIYYQF